MNDMIGGGFKNMCKDFAKDSHITLFFMAVLIVLFKTLIVQWSYNQIWPVLVVNSGNSASKFKPLTFYQALLFVLLIEFLF
jgi:hypothetical protein